MFKAIRWVSFFANSYVNHDLEELPEVSAMYRDYAETLEWESSPNREISVEILAEDVGSFSIMSESLGLVVDTEQMQLSRVYAEDAWTTLQPDGTIRSTTVDETVGKQINWSDQLDDLKLVYYSISPNERENWCEAVISQPRYIGWVAHEDTDVEELEPLIKRFFGDIPQMKISFAEEF